MGERPPAEVIEAYVTRKQAKGTWGNPKPRKHIYYRRRWWQRKRPVLTGQCPCAECGHRGEAMIVCDADWMDCKCCNEWCS